MTRGNQREIDRARAAARHDGKGTAKEGDFLARKVSNFTNAQKNVEGVKCMVVNYF